ncbi:MAG: hypothetical protein EOP56_02130 [Sphingobacteriales bacterium]|nr:MAG: hypothetical protein EOP56_02130 [Sphingobacteriales bacterium]
MLASCNTGKSNTADFITYIADPKKVDIRLYWKDDKGQLINSLGRLREYIISKNRKLVFAANAGMYKPDHAPQGLFIRNGHTIVAVDSGSGFGNFYLKPNGIFYITRGKKAVVCRTASFRYDPDVLFATQSGPMMVVEGQIHDSFRASSTSLNIRNGVGVLPDGRIVFAMSAKEVNFYTFASYFKELGCWNALYLDGFVSRTYLPEKNWEQFDGDFGVMIGVTE